MKMVLSNKVILCLASPQILIYALVNCGLFGLSQPENPTCSIAPNEKRAPNIVRHPLRFGYVFRLLQNLNLDVTEPNVITVILETDVTLVVLTTYVSEELVSYWPLLLRELRVVDHLSPLVSPQVILYYWLIVLIVNNSTLVAKDLNLVPLASRLSVLGLCRDHIIQ